MQVDVPQHLRNDNYPIDIHLRRILWALLSPLFRLSPRPLYAWRIWLLRRLGANIGNRVRLYPSVQVMFPWNLEIGDDVLISWDVRLYSLAPIRIASNVLISQGAHLCAGSHDYRKSNFPLILRPICVASGAWLAAECFIGTGVVIGAGAVVAARAVVVRDVPPGAVVAGNPARVVKTST